VPSCLEHDAHGPPRRIGAQLEDLGLEREHLEQVVEAGSGLRRHVATDDVAAEILGHEIVLHQALTRALRVGVGQIALVDRHDDRAARRLGVLDRLDRRPPPPAPPRR
jgi:hypothetical protein